MTRLDENRAKSQLAKKAGVDVTAVTQRRHLGQSFRDPVSRTSTTRKINGKPATEVIRRSKHG